DAETGKPRPTWGPAPSAGRITAIQILTDHEVAFGDTIAGITIWDTETRREIRRLPLPCSSPLQVRLSAHLAVFYTLGGRYYLQRIDTGGYEQLYLDRTVLFGEVVPLDDTLLLLHSHANSLSLELISSEGSHIWNTVLGTQYDRVAAQSRGVV